MWCYEIERAVLNGLMWSERWRRSPRRRSRVIYDHNLIRYTEISGALHLLIRRRNLLLLSLVCCFTRAVHPGMQDSKCPLWKTFAKYMNYAH
ncbi:hypothetical protein FA95DRAFT_1557996 [Auriscalpium vulgare]|uniref:Uncharacterized protein n=1 Tax=Auriscalpium vulgare TaxID=40419 RepID=A0ACB8RWR6_9AGAM|nr:hypothetical protein FA95DRAFT_1557996 [Auriscalpium vulgare]